MDSVVIAWLALNGCKQGSLLSTLEDRMAKRKQWEYEAIPASPENDFAGFDTKLNDLGKKGWELVAAES